MAFEHPLSKKSPTAAKAGEIQGKISALEADLKALRQGAAQTAKDYRFADGELNQVSEDHSLVGEMYRAGRITADEATTHPQRHIVTRALGIGEDLLVDYWELPAREGDRYLLCSDGLVDEVADGRSRRLCADSTIPMRLRTSSSASPTNRGAATTCRSSSYGSTPASTAATTWR